MDPAPAAADPPPYSAKPPQHDASSGDTKCGFDVTYIKSIHGILKLKQMGWSFLAFLLACIAINKGVAEIFFIIFVFFGMLLTIIVWFMFATHLYKKVTRINWFLADLILCAVATLVYFALSIPVLVSPLSPLSIAAGVFGFVALLSYAVGVWYSFKRWRESNVRQSSNDKQYSVDY